MARALWKGVIEFGAVAVPVKLYTAVRPQQIHFHMLQQMVCPAHGDREVPREHIIRGYELSKDQYVVVQEQDLEKCSPLASRTIRVRRFVDPAQIDPLFYEKPYYLGPDEHGHKPYALLARALRHEKKVAVVDFVMRGKQYLGAVRVSADGRALVLETMRYADEVVATGEVEEEIRKLKVDERQVKMAEQLIDTLAASFEPERYRDEYRACVMDMIERKARGEKLTIKVPKQPKATKAPDLTDMLQASIAQAKSRGGKHIEHPASRHKPRA
jgi:DNA end-binding protein Ku